MSTTGESYGPGINGRLDPYIVPAGSKFTVSCSSIVFAKIG